MKPLLLAALAAASFVAAADSLKATAVSVGNKASAAIAHKDFAAFQAALKPHLAPGFKYIEGGKSMTFDQMIAGMKQGLAPMKVKRAYATVTGCAQHGRTGTVTAVHGVVIEMTGTDHKPHKLVVGGSSRDTWVNIGGTWKLQTMNWLNNKVTMDGKAVGSPARPTQVPVGPAN